jgi:hypothetical protein
MPERPDSSNPQCKYNRYEGTCLESFKALGLFEPTFIEAHQAFNLIGNIRLLKSQIKTQSLLEGIITLSNEVFKDFEYDLAVQIRDLGNAA